MPRKTEELKKTQLREETNGRLRLVEVVGPLKAKDIQAIAAVQRTFTHKITEVQHLNYWERLHEFKLYSLQRCRERYKII